jgi:hypothetical protein
MQEVIIMVGEGGRQKWKKKGATKDNLHFNE